MKDFCKNIDMNAIKNAIRIGSVIVMACFFFPFYTVSCGVQTVELSGADLAKGIENATEPAPIVYGLLLLAAAILVVTFVAKLKPYHVVIELVGAGAGLVYMILIHSGVVNKLKELGASSSEISEGLSIELGFWGCVIGFGMIAVAALLEAKK